MRERRIVEEAGEVFYGPPPAEESRRAIRETLGMLPQAEAETKKRRYLATLDLARRTGTGWRQWGLSEWEAFADAHPDPEGDLSAVPEGDELVGADGAEAGDEPAQGRPGAARALQAQVDRAGPAGLVGDRQGVGSLPALEGPPPGSL